MSQEPSPPTPTAVPPSVAPYRPNFAFLAVVSIVTLAADLGSKWWAKAHLFDPMSPNRRIVLLPGHFRLIYAENQGGAWGFLGGESEAIRRPFFLGISVVAILFILSLYRRLAADQWALRWGLPLVLGGALGNLVNRIQFNYVVDFLDCWVTTGTGEKHWPTFNVADIAIVVGVGLMAVDMFTSRRTSGATPPPAVRVDAPPATDAPEISAPTDAPRSQES